MTFDPQTLLQAPPLTVDSLAARLAQLSAMGLGDASVTLQGGRSINAVDLVAQGDVPAHVVLIQK